jgi:hypothetical protein
VKEGRKKKNKKKKRLTTVSSTVWSESNYLRASQARAFRFFLGMDPGSGVWVGAR